MLRAVSLGIVETSDADPREGDDQKVMETKRVVPWLDGGVVWRDDALVAAVVVEDALTMVVVGSF